MAPGGSRVTPESAVRRGIGPAPAAGDVPPARQPGLGGFAAVNPATRLAQVVTALEQVGLTALVMGGHAVRYYGIDRNPIGHGLGRGGAGGVSPPSGVGRQRLSDPRS